MLQINNFSGILEPCKIAFNKARLLKHDLPVHGTSKNATHWLTSPPGFPIICFALSVSDGALCGPFLSQTPFFSGSCCEILSPFGPDLK